MTRSASATLLLGALFAAACETEPRTESDRMALTDQTRGSLASFKDTDPSVSKLLGESVGYAVFPDVGKAGFIAGGAYGHGEVYENGRLVGYADIAQGTIGLQIGAQSYDELIIFLTDDQLAKFKSNQFAFSANASAVALKPGAAAAADHSRGVIVEVKPRGGLMAEASIGGQQFTYVPLDANERTTTKTTTTKTTESHRDEKIDKNNP